MILPDQPLSGFNTRKLWLSFSLILFGCAENTPQNSVASLPDDVTRMIGGLEVTRTCRSQSFLDYRHHSEEEYQFRTNEQTAFYFVKNSNVDALVVLTFKTQNQRRPCQYLIKFGNGPTSLVFSKFTKSEEDFAPQEQVQFQLESEICPYLSINDANSRYPGAAFEFETNRGLSNEFAGFGGCARILPYYITGFNVRNGSQIYRIVLIADRLIITRLNS
ncbi:MAG: hypothetical protein GQ535_01765 [Rhodobacteraceae bacterium]|nr:hypothetical protein [Paracoccaceae bacterium]